jgi:hypothetical protein
MKGPIKAGELLGAVNESRGVCVCVRERERRERERRKREEREEKSVRMPEPHKQVTDRGARL